MRRPRPTVSQPRPHRARGWYVVALGVVAGAVGTVVAAAPQVAVASTGLVLIAILPLTVPLALLATMAWPIVLLPAGTGGAASAALGLSFTCSFLIHSDRLAWLDHRESLRVRAWPLGVGLVLAAYLTIATYWSPSPESWIRIVLLWTTSVPVFLITYLRRPAGLPLGVVLLATPVVLGLLVSGDTPFGMNPISALAIAASGILALCGQLGRRPIAVAAILAAGALLVLTGAKTGPKIAFAVALLHFVWASRATTWGAAAFSGRHGRLISMTLGTAGGAVAIALGLREAVRRLTSADLIQSRSVTYRRDLWVEGLSSRDPFGAGLLATSERPHNLLVEAWAAGGVIGALCVLALLAGTAIVVFRRRSVADSFLIPHVVLLLTSGGIAESWPMWLALGWLLSPKTVGPVREGAGTFENLDSAERRLRRNLREASPSRA
jgi:hypothetical protein